MAKKKDTEEPQDTEEESTASPGPAHEPTPDRSAQSPHEPTAE